MPESVTDRPTRSHEYVFLLSKSPRYFYDAQAIAEPLDRPDEGTRKTPAKFGGAQKHEEAGKQSRLHSGHEYTGTPTGTRNKRTVWRLSTQSSGLDHYAMFPEALAEICLLAGSSPRACECCGSPWARVVERSLTAPLIDRPYLGNGQQRANGTAGGNGIDHSSLGQQDKVQRTTTGWNPTCRCTNEGTGRSIVLDPFSGSGTVSRVAIKHGRDAINCELNAAYLPLIDKRTDGVQTMLEVA